MNNSNQLALIRFEAAMDNLRRSMATARERLGADLQLSRTQLEIMMILADHPARTVGELARQLFLTASAVTQTVDTLARRDLLLRQPDETDRRAIRLSLSPSGQTMVAGVRAAKQRNLRQLVAQLTPDEIDATIKATEKLSVLMQTTRYQ